MADYYRRDRYDDDEVRRPSREDSSRDWDHYNDRGRDDRYPPPGRPQSRERHQDRDREDYFYRNRDRSRDARVDDRDWYHEPRDRDDYQYSTQQGSKGRPVSPAARDIGEYETRPPREPRSDRQRGSYEDASYDAGKPNSQVIFRGLDKDMTESDLQQFLQNQGAAVESVIVIRDKETRESRGFAFVKFFAVEAAQDYMERHYPVVQIGENNVKIAYSLGRGEEDNGWTCDKCSLVNFPRREVCYRCGYPRSDVTPSSPPKSLTQKVWSFNDGSGDVGESPSQFLLVRGLDTMLREENIANGMAKLESEPKRVLLIRDRKTNVSWGFAFVEYQDVSYAQSAFERYQNYKTFKIEKSKVKISFCHPGVFVPVYADAGKYAFKTSSGASIAYWDEFAFASEWVKPGVEGISLEKFFLILAPKDEEMAKFYNDLKAAEALHSAAATIIQEPVMRVTKPSEGDSIKRESTETTDQQKKKRKVESVATAKKPVAQLEKWATKRQELKAEVSESSADVSEFADLNQICCLLCRRKFQSIEEIQKHESMSKLHKSNLADDALRNACLEKLQKTKPTQPDSAYRDRARERRIQFNQPHRPDLPHPNPRIAAKQAAAAAAAKQESPEPEPARQNKGAQLLAAMGWTKGTGLGAEGTGIVEPVKAESYAEGVGLGAGSVKVVGEDIGGKDDDGSYRAYVRKVKEFARGRYENEKDTEE